MFREMRRKKQLLSEDECLEVLEGQVRGVLSVLGDDGYPYGVPIDYWRDPENGHICFHGARRGHKVDAIRACDKASFCVYDEGYREEGEWALNIRSVIVFGHVQLVADEARAEAICRALCTRFPCDQVYADKEVARSLRAVQCLELVPAHMTGKLVNEA